MTVGDNIAAIATASGRGGVAVVRLSGPDALSIAAHLMANGKEGTGSGEEKSGMRVAKLYSPSPVPSSPFPVPSPQLLDEAVVLTFKGPHSYTGEDVVELQCHGGTVTPRRVLEACLQAGARLARRGEFTERAFLNGRLDYAQAEAVLDLVNARTDRAADAALEGLSGEKSRACRELYEAALDLSTHVEHALDVDEEELTDAFFADLDARLSALVVRLETAIRRVREGKLLREGALVVLAGPPNAGKSSLLNALLEENRAIVSDLPGTTRDAIEEGLNIEGWPIRLVDTAGLRETEDAIEAEGVKRSEDIMEKADIVIWLESDGAEGGRVMNHPCASFKLQPSTCLLLHSKCDLKRGEGLNVSAKTGEGLDALKREIVARLEKRLGEVEDGPDSSADRLSALYDARAALRSLPSPIPACDLVLVGNALRQAAERLGALVGAVYTSDFLDNLFSRFCVGK